MGRKGEINVGQWLWNAAEWFGKHKYLIFLVMTPFILCYNWLLFSAEVIGPFNKQNLPYFGDAFAPLNSLFSGMALVGVLVTIILQKKELEETRRELAASAAAHEETVQLMKWEQLRSEFEGRRAATPALMATDIASRDHKTSVFFTLENVGQTIFDPRLRICPSSPFEMDDIKCAPPVVLPKGARFPVVVRLWPAAVGGAKVLAFFIHCVDSTGADRKVKIAGQFAVGASLTQVEADFPTWEDEEDAVVRESDSSFLRYHGYRRL